ncbi:hypothetical protein, partial [Siminovitchia fortis]|uniref:hypothetical protein n=1 Tax=Siminovitchia fortis TaxID=254758 RepID=UPI001C92EEB7
TFIILAPTSYISLYSTLPSKQYLITSFPYSNLFSLALPYKKPPLSPTIPPYINLAPSSLILKHSSPNLL